MTAPRRIVLGDHVDADAMAVMAATASADPSGACELLTRVQAPLRELFRTRRNVIVAASAPVGLLESAARSGITDRVLAVIGGRDGQRFADVAEACGKEVIRAHVPEGATLEPRHLACFLDGPDVDAVTVVHAETSSGALAPMEELARVVRSRTGVLLLVDATASLGADPLETDLWGLDMVVTGTDGALGLPAGLALGAASERMIVRAREAASRGWALDLVRLDEAARHGTPADGLPYPLLRALERRLERIAGAGGATAAWRHHATLREALDRWLAEHPEWTPLAREDRRAAAITVLRRAARPSDGRVELTLPGGLAPEAVGGMLDTLVTAAGPVPAV